jgi:hypothetical protein
MMFSKYVLLCCEENVVFCFWLRTYVFALFFLADAKSNLSLKCAIVLYPKSQNAVVVNKR